MSENAQNAKNQKAPQEKEPRIHMVHVTSPYKKELFELFERELEFTLFQLGFDAKCTTNKSTRYPQARVFFSSNEKFVNQQVVYFPCYTSHKKHWYSLFATQELKLAFTI